MTGFQGCFGPKKAALGHKMLTFGRAPPDLAPPPRGATGEFLAENLAFAPMTRHGVNVKVTSLRVPLYFKSNH